MLYMFSSFSMVSLFVELQINPFRLCPSHSATESQSFKFSVTILSRSALAGEAENIFSPGPEPAIGGPEDDSHTVASIRVCVCVWGGGGHCHIKHLLSDISINAGL
jgi:hypothetical protein